MLKILEIGPGVTPKAAKLWAKQEPQVTTVDLWPEAKADFRADARKLPEELRQGQFDVVFASHVLEHVPWFESTDCVKGWAECLKPGGAMHVIVPSLEWAAREALRDEPSPAIQPHLCAGLATPWDVHVAQFTMRRLRAVMEAAGLRVTAARSGKYPILVLGKEHTAEQHYAKAVKNATQEGHEQDNDLGKHRGADPGGIQARPGGRNRARQGRKRQGQGEEKAR